MLLRNNPTLFSFLRTHTCKHTGASVCTETRVHTYCKITPRINTLVTKPKDLSSISNNHMVKETNNIYIYNFPSVKERSPHFFFLEGGKSLDAVSICFPSLRQTLEIKQLKRRGREKALERECSLWMHEELSSMPSTHI